MLRANAILVSLLAIALGCFAAAGAFLDEAYAAGLIHTPVAGYVRLDASVGFGGKFRAERPVPIRVTLESHDEALEGQVVVSVPQGSLVRRNVRRVLHTFPISLPRGGRISRKLIVAPVEVSLPLTVEFVSNGRKIAAKVVDLRPLAVSEDLAVLLQSAPGAGRLRPGDWGYVFSLAAPSDMPESSLGLLGVRVIVSCLDDLMYLGGSELEALRRWIHMGGRLLVWEGGGDPGKISARIKALLPRLPEQEGGRDVIRVVERRLGLGVTALALGGKDSLNQSVSQVMGGSARELRWVPQYSEGLERSMYSMLSLMPYVGPDARPPLRFLAVYLVMACAAIFAGCFDRTGYKWHFGFLGGVVLLFSIVSAVAVAPLVNEDKTYLMQVDTLIGETGSRYVGLTSYVKLDSLNGGSFDVVPFEYSGPSVSWVLPSLGKRELPPLWVSYSEGVRLPAFGGAGATDGGDYIRVDADFDFPIHIAFGNSNAGFGFLFTNLSPWKIAGCIIGYRGRFAYIGELDPGDTRQVSLEDLSLDADGVIGRSSTAIRGSGGRPQRQVENKLRELLLSRVIRITEPAPLGIPGGAGSVSWALFIGWVRSLPFGIAVDGQRPRESRVSCLILRVALGPRRDFFESPPTQPASR